LAENNQDINTEHLSDDASPKRLQDFRDKGQVAQSRELVALFIALATGMTVFTMAPSMAEELIRFMKETFSQSLTAKPNDNMQQLAGNRLLDMLGVLAKLIPDLNKINPINGLKRIFSGRNLIETARVIVKGIILCYVSYVMIKSDILESPSLIFKNPSAIFDVLGTAGKHLFLALLGVLGVFAGIDFFLQKQEYGKQVRTRRGSNGQVTHPQHST
jgi:flagellar biosynthesis protein FlhB